MLYVIPSKARNLWKILRHFVPQNDKRKFSVTFTIVIFGQVRKEYISVLVYSKQGIICEIVISVNVFNTERIIIIRFGKVLIDDIVAVTPFVNISFYFRVIIRIVKGFDFIAFFEFLNTSCVNDRSDMCRIQFLQTSYVSWKCEKGLSCSGRAQETYR